jgi:hypothetical protein
MANEAVLANANEFADKAVRLHPRPCTDARILLDFDERTDEAAVTYMATIQIGRLHNLDARAENNVANAAFQKLRQVLRHYALLVGTAWE